MGLEHTRRDKWVFIFSVGGVALDFLYLLSPEIIKLSNSSLPSSQIESQRFGMPLMHGRPPLGILARAVTSASFWRSTLHSSSPCAVPRRENDIALPYPRNPPQSDDTGHYGELDVRTPRIADDEVAPIVYARHPETLTQDDSPFRPTPAPAAVKGSPPGITITVPYLTDWLLILINAMYAIHEKLSSGRSLTQKQIQGMLQDAFGYKPEKVGGLVRDAKPLARLIEPNDMKYGNGQGRTPMPKNYVSILENLPYYRELVAYRSQPQTSPPYNLAPALN